MHLAPLASVLSAVFLGLPLTFAQHLDARAIDQQMQHIRLAAIRDFYLQFLLASRNRAEVRHWPVQPRQLQQAFNQPDALT